MLSILFLVLGSSNNEILVSAQAAVATTSVATSGGAAAAASAAASSAVGGSDPSAAAASAASAAVSGGGGLVDNSNAATTGSEGDGSTAIDTSGGGAAAAASAVAVTGQENTVPVEVVVVEQPVAPTNPPTQGSIRGGGSLQLPGASYCTRAPNMQCYPSSNGFPPCCATNNCPFGGVNVAAPPCERQQSQPVVPVVVAIPKTPAPTPINRGITIPAVRPLTTPGPTPIPTKSPVPVVQAIPKTPAPINRGITIPAVTPGPTPYPTNHPQLRTPNPTPYTNSPTPNPTPNPTQHRVITTPNPTPNPTDAPVINRGVGGDFLVVGVSFCTFAPDLNCYPNTGGWPPCCATHTCMNNGVGIAPPDCEASTRDTVLVVVPEVQQSYCTMNPDMNCYPNSGGYPACCARHNCPNGGIGHKPPCTRQPAIVPPPLEGMPNRANKPFDLFATNQEQKDEVCIVCTKSAPFLLRHETSEECDLHCSLDVLEAIGGKVYITAASNYVAGQCTLICHVIYDDYSADISQFNVCPAVGFCHH